MKKTLLIVVIMLLVIGIADAKIYVCLSKSNGEPQGVVDITENNVGDWSNNFTMIAADESYRGLQGYEVKYQGNKLRKSTAQEIATYKANLDAASLAKKKEDALATIGLTQHDLDKVKALPGL